MQDMRLLSGILHNLPKVDLKPLGEKEVFGLVYCFATSAWAALEAAKEKAEEGGKSSPFCVGVAVGYIGAIYTLRDALRGWPKEAETDYEKQALRLITKALRNTIGEEEKTPNS